ncbi:MAG TPA: FIST N-terminal domain-containing protein [Planctomycetota bacterium]|jgi:small ligand-binding sensory domain FIST
MKWASALSLSPQFGTAISEAAATVQRRLGGLRPDIVFVFVSPHHRASFPKIPGELLSRLNPRHILGCSGGGVIGDGREAEQVAALSLTGAVLPGVELATFHLQDRQLPSPDCSPRRWEEITGVKAAQNPELVVLGDPLSIRTDELLAGLDFAFPSAAKIGGLASGARRAGENALFMDGRHLQEGAVGLALSGDIQVETVLSQGCRPVGRPLSITKCHRNILLELDHKPALEVLSDLYRRSEERDRELLPSSLFLGLVMDPFKLDEPGPGDFLIRIPVGMDTERGALVIVAVLRKGQIVQFHLRDASWCGEQLQSVLREYVRNRLDASSVEGAPALPQGALLFTSMGRGKHLYGKADHDTQAFRSEVGEVPLAGFFCNGEIGPVAGATHVHGFTSCFAMFSGKNC